MDDAAGDRVYSVLGVDLTALSWLLAIFGGYYVFLFTSLYIRRLSGVRGLDRSYSPLMCVVIPAHNEEGVIAHTIEALLRQTYTERLIVIMNDGSTDATHEIAARYIGDEVMVVDRGPEIAGRGKGAVLNHAYGILCGMVDRGDQLLRGRTAENIVVCIVDADGQLESNTLAEVAPYFSDPVVGGVQIGVRIANANANFLTRMQDMEFVGFSAMVQEARDAWGSVGLGGNGQFTRLSALQSIGDTPWSDCLTEDLDLGLNLARGGWRIRFCLSAWVAQQAVLDFKALFRQRTRWIQGHYQCWTHAPHIAKASRMPLAMRVDLLIYLFLGCYVWLVAAGPVAGLLTTAGVIQADSSFLVWIQNDVVRATIKFLLSVAPLSVFIISYQLRSLDPFKGRWLPAIMVLFTAYTYTMLLSQAWALWRLAVGKDGWAKTARVQSEAAV